MDSASDSDNRESRRWPQVVRPHPRPGGSNNTQEVSAPSNESVSRRPRSRTPSTSTEQSRDDSPSSASKSVFLAGETITESPISSPTLLDGQRSFSPTPSPTHPRGALSRSRPVKKSSLLSSGSSSASDLIAIDELSQSRRRWDDLRRHFLPPQPSARASQVQPLTAPPPISDLPQRPSSPRQFRIPKFGFKQVVEQARGSVVNQNKRFADDILGASRAMRAIEPKVQRREREGTLATMATSFNMSFMSSNASLGTANIPTSNYLPQSRTRLRRPPSLQSEVSLSPVAVTTSLHAIISHHASIPSSQLHFVKFLPHENEVLSALLVPFMTPRSEAAYSERLQAMESFETIVRTWQAASDEDFLGRCLWCYKVARMIQDQKEIRTRVLNALVTCLFSPGDPSKIGSVIILQTLFQALFSLQGSLLAEGDSEEASYVYELINGVKKAGCEGLNASLMMQQYGDQVRSEADAQAVLDCVIIMALASCTENAPNSERRSMLNNLMAVKEDWFSATGSSHYSPSLMHIETLCVTQCTHALLNCLQSTDGSRSSAEDCYSVFKILTEWSIPAAHALVSDGSSDCKIMSARLALGILSFSRRETGEPIGLVIEKWYRDSGQWKAAFEAAIQIVVKEKKWEMVVAVLLALMDLLPHELCLAAAMRFLPVLNEKLVLDPPPLPFLALTELLEIVSQKLPKLFYKPLFACAAGTKTSSILNHLRTIAMVARHLPSFWIRDSEMLLVALMSDSGGKEKGPQDNVGPSWGQIRLGQLVVLIELIAHIRAMRQDKDGLSSSTFLAQARFFFELEHRLGVFIDRKERMLLLPVTQRILLVILFLEIRLLLRSLKPAQWLPRIISWVLSSEEDIQVPENDTTPILETLAEIYSALQQWSIAPQKRQSAGLLTPTGPMDGASSGTGALLTATPHLLTSSTRQQELKDLSKGLIANSLRLLVAISGLLSKEDHESLCGLLWQGCLTHAPCEIQPLATFLIMQCAENAPTAMLDLIRRDIRSPQAFRRLLAGRRLSLISGWRFQMLSQNFIVDKNHRRPFKLVRVPVSFLPTDIGSSSFVPREDLAKGNSTGGQALPLELRKRLADIGWTQDESTTDQKQEWMMTPFSLISGQQLEKVEAGLPSTMVTRSPQPGALERPLSPAVEQKASTRGVKRRPIFVPPLVSILPDLTSLVYDDDYGVANAARVAVMDWMRHDPALITRPALDALSAKENSLHPAFSIFRGYLYAQSTLPPAMAHHMFNHLAGFLRFSAREGGGKEALTGFAYTVPLLSKLVGQVSDMSLRELRRAKIDAFLVPSGSLWFPSSAPAGSMFPRSLSDIKGSSDEGSDAVYQLSKVILVRVAQNLLFANMLKRDRQEVQAFRKNMPRLVLPTIDSTITLSTEPRSFLPNKQRTSSLAIGADTDTLGLSLLLSRSYVLLVTDIFRSLPRHLSDRSELAILIDGLNHILFVHGDDIGIVAHVLIALMTASARFHRLFTSGGGYTLFIPALFKVYAEAESNEGVRRAIEYSINRFYAVHQEAFVFQALNMLSHIVMVPEVDGPWVAKQIFLLLSTLKDDAPVHAPDAAGIHGSNKTQEQEALMLRTAEERPQAFLALLRKTSGSQGEDVGVAVPDQYDSGHLSLDNFVRLLLTVIGHDPSIRRAEQFLRLLRLMGPHFFDAPVARDVLLEGINALSLIFVIRGTGKTKATEHSQNRAEGSFSQAASASVDAFEAAKSPSNFTEMKFDYLSLVREVSKSGGSFGSSALRRILDLTKTILRDSDPNDGERVASFLGLFANDVLLRNTSDPQLKQVLALLTELGPIFKAHAGVVDFSKMLEVVVCLVENPVYANQPAFSHVVVTHFCMAGLEVFDQLASDGFAFSTPFRPVLVRLLCRATLLTGTDVVSLIERRSITFEFVAGILYPMALNLPSAAKIASDTRWMEAWRREAIRRMWICLLQKVMLACQGQRSTSTSDRTEKLSQPERRRSQEKKGNVVKNYPGATLSMALQTLKIIVLKAEDELSFSLPNIWVQMGLLLKNVLSAGNARFATQDRVTSATSSPRQPSTGLPRTSEDSDLLMPPSPRIASSRPHSPQPPSCPQPFLLDYLLWSMLEFVCHHRSPLMLQLRLFLREATATLDEELHVQQAPAIRSKRFSYTSVFAKTPQRLTNRSKAPSPEATPFLTPLRLNHGDALLTPPKPERMPGYARSPTTPGGSEVMEPRIVHLGPVQNFDMFHRSPSPGLGEGGTKSRKWLLANSTTISSLKLVINTYRRIRAVQRFMGYTDLLPAPDGAEGSIDDVRAWPRGTAWSEIEGETAELIEEFWSQDED